jgi:hypothetical protein
MFAHTRSHLGFVQIAYGQFSLLPLVALGCSYLLYQATNQECEAEERRETVEPVYVRAIRMAATGNLEELKAITAAQCKRDRSAIEYAAEFIFTYPRQFLNKKHPAGWTALHAAVCNQHEDVVRWLVENGANVNVGDTYQPV